MALTTAQLNAHIRDMAQNQLVVTGERTDREVLMWWMKACLRHWRLGDADSQEAAQTVAQEVSQRVLGRSLTADDLHLMRRHWTREADDTATGDEL